MENSINYARELAEIVKEREAIDKLRISLIVTEEEQSRLEIESLLLRRREREILSKIGKEVAAAIEESSSALKALSNSIKKKTNKMARTTAKLDKVGKEVGKVARELSANINKK